MLSRDQQRSRAESTLTGSRERRVPSHEVGPTSYILHPTSYRRVPSHEAGDDALEEGAGVGEHVDGDEHGSRAYGPPPFVIPRARTGLKALVELGESVVHMLSVLSELLPLPLVHRSNSMKRGFEGYPQPVEHYSLTEAGSALLTQYDRDGSQPELVLPIPLFNLQQHATCATGRPEMHTAFTATRLGDVQEELALQAAIAASAANVQERIEVITMAAMQSTSTAAPSAAACAATTAALSCLFTQEHIGCYVNIVNGKVLVKRSQKKRSKMQDHPVIWDGQPPPTVAGIISQVTEGSVALQGGKAFPNPAKADKVAEQWDRFELHRAGMLTASQRRRTAATVGPASVSQTPEHQLSPRAKNITASPAAAQSCTLNLPPQSFEPGSGKLVQQAEAQRERRARPPKGQSKGGSSSKGITAKMRHSHPEVDRWVVPWVGEQARPSMEFCVMYELLVVHAMHIRLSNEQLSTLVSLPPQAATDALRCMRLGLPVLNSTDTLPCVGSTRGAASAKIYSVVVTPTRILALPVMLERTSRVVRTVNSLTGSTECLLRLTFVADEEMSLISLQPPSPEVVHRIQSVLDQGITLCGRHYVFFAFSSSQLKQASCWFISETGLVSAESLRASLGDFSSSRHSPPKLAARMGQCFSSTLESLEVEDRGRMLDAKLVEGATRWVEAPDIERDGYNFTDGNGSGSPILFERLASSLALRRVPSAVQLRLGGLKGIVAVDTRMSGNDSVLCSRPSMDKFKSDARVLEVCEVSTWRCGRLNRQLITLLSTLGVPDSVFLELLQTELLQLREVHEASSAQMLLSEMPDGAMKAIMEELGRCFLRHEPFVDRVLHALQVCGALSVLSLPSIYD